MWWETVGWLRPSGFCEIADAGLATVGGGDHRQQPDAVPVGVLEQLADRVGRLAPRLAAVS